MKFDNDKDFLNAFRQEINDRTNNNFFEVDNTLQDVALERSIARFDPKEVCVKGGFGVRSILKEAPYTQDIDILIDKQDWQKLGRGVAGQEKFVNYVFDAMEQPLTDGVHFKRLGWVPYLEGGPTEPVVKSYFSASLKGERLGNIQIDAAIKPEGMAIETHSGRNYLGFAGVENPVIKTASKEYIVADKLTLLLTDGHDRPRDYVHASLLLDKDVDSKTLFRHMKELAKIRGVEKKLTGYVEPTKKLGECITQVCREHRLNLNSNQCIERVNNVFDRFNNREKTQIRIDIDLDKEGRGPEAPKQPRGQSRIPGAKELAKKSTPEKAEARTQTPRSSLIKQPSAREIVQFSRNELPKIAIDRQSGISRNPGVDRAAGMEKGHEARSQSPRSSSIKQPSAREIVQFGRNELPKISIDRQSGISRTPGFDRAAGIDKGSPGAERGIGPATSGGDRSQGPGRGYGGASPGREGGFNTGGRER